LARTLSSEVMREVYARMAELEREGRRFAVCTVVRTVGSTPQVVGAKLLVDDLGRLTGTLGGGCVEGDAFVEAKHVIETGDAALRQYELTEDLAWDTGLVCGGTMWIAIEPGEIALRLGERDLLGDVLAASSGGRPVAIATLLRKRGRELEPSGKLFIEMDGRSHGSVGERDADARSAALEALRQGTARTITLDDDHELLIEPVLAEHKMELVELLCRPQGGQLRIKILVDAVGGVTLKRCADVNRAIGGVLDASGLIEERHTIEVSSPGLDRPLKRWTDFDRIIGRRVRIFTAAPLDARTEHHGEVLAANEENVVLRLDSGDKLPIPLNQIVRAEQEIKL